MNTCAYCLKGCNCENGVKDPDCDAVLCDEPGTDMVHGEWLCEKHRVRIQALVDHREKGTPLPADHMEQHHADRRARGLE
jgi:hypothetical protein